MKNLFYTCENKLNYLPLITYRFTALILFLTFTLSLAFISCGGGSKDNPVTTTTTTSTTTTITGTAEVPNDVTLTQSKFSIFNIVKNLFFSEVSAVSNKKPLANADVTMNVLNKQGTLVELGNIAKAVTDEKGNFRFNVKKRLLF